MKTQSVMQPEAQTKPARRSTPDGGTASAHLEAVASDLADRAREMVKSGRTHMTEWRDGFQSGVRHRPIQSVLIAVAAGAVLGLILARR